MVVPIAQKRASLHLEAGSGWSLDYDAQTSLSRRIVRLLVRSSVDAVCNSCWIIHHSLHPKNLSETSLKALVSGSLGTRAMPSLDRSQLQRATDYHKSRSLSNRDRRPHGGHATRSRDPIPVVPYRISSRENRLWRSHHSSLLEVEKRRGGASGLKFPSHLPSRPRTTATLQ